MCAIKACTYKNLRGQHPLRAEMYPPQKKNPLGWLNVSQYNFFVYGPKFTGLSSLNAEGIAVDHISFQFWISAAVPEIFAIKVESCQKSRWISDVFLLSQILGGRPSRSYIHVMISAWRHVVWKMFREDTPTSQEVIVANTLNFKPNFKFSPLTFFGGPPSHFRLCAIKAWEISSACINFRAQHPLMA